jgi:hypothetical protein
MGRYLTHNEGGDPLNGYGTTAEAVDRGQAASVRGWNDASLHQEKRGR